MLGSGCFKNYVTFHLVIRGNYPTNILSTMSETTSYYRHEISSLSSIVIISQRADLMNNV